MKLAKRGFTIVELLIVIVVIAILASISIITYNGIQTRTYNTVAINELSEWRKMLELCRALEGSLPSVPDGVYCLGTNFPIGYGGTANCFYIDDSRFYASEQSSTQLMNELRKVGGLPGGPRPAVNGIVGPFAESTGEEIILITVLQGDDPALCVEPTKLLWQDHNGSVLCEASVPR